MTKLRSVLVRRDTLAGVATTIKLGDYLCMGKGEEASGGRYRPANLAGALEAVIGAVFLDRGIAIARNVVLKLFDEELQEVIGQGKVVDYKSQLQELIQSRYQVAPVYQLVGATGPDHDKTFTVDAVVNGVILGRGMGRSKKMAETEAARLALEQLAAGFTL
jgi:ribonuclease-3